MERRDNTMRENYDFSNAKRGPVSSPGGKTRVTIMLDNDVIRAFRDQAEAKGIGYQTLINQTLRQAIFQSKPELSEDRLRTVIREELADYNPTNSDH